MVKEVTAVFDRGLRLRHSQATLCCKRELDCTSRLMTAGDVTAERSKEII